MAVNEKIRATGFPQALQFSGRSVVADSNCGAGDIYGICSKKVKLLVVKGCSFNIGKFIEPVNEQYIAAKLTARLNLAFQTRRPAGKEYGATTA